MMNKVSFFSCLSLGKSRVKVKQRRRLRNQRSDRINVHFPEEIIHKILLRLPVKSLLRFRSVCKEWNSTIRGHSFAMMHYRHQQENNQGNNNLRLMLHDIRGTFYTVNCTTMDKAIKTIPCFDFVTGSFVFICGSCDGLLLVVMGNLMCLWNPTINKHTSLPLIKSTKRVHITSCGFGYDQLREDFKVLCLTQKDHNAEDFTGNVEDLTGKAYLYTRRSNSWKKIDNIPYHLRGFWEGMTLVKEKLYCVATKLSLHRPEFLLSFDIQYEKFREMPLPNYDNGNDDYVVRHWRVTSLREKICVIANSGTKHDIWIMDDCGVEESWTRKANIVCDGSPSTVCFLENDYKIILHVYKSFIVADMFTYDTKKKKWKNRNIRGVPPWYRSETYVETLISPNAVGSAQQRLG